MLGSLEGLSNKKMRFFFLSFKFFFFFVNYFAYKHILFYHDITILCSPILTLLEHIWFKINNSLLKK